MGRLGGGEILLILLIALLIFGPSKLADMGKGLGQGLKNFKKGISHADETDDEPKPPAPTAATPEPPKELTAGIARADEPPAPVAATEQGDPSRPAAESAAPAVASEEPTGSAEPHRRPPPSSAN